MSEEREGRPIKVADLAERWRPSGIVVVSPHLDDAVLSVGALMYDAAGAGLPVHVVTVFSGAWPSVVSPVAASYLRHCGDVDPQTRWLEDAQALEIVHARGVHLGYLDAVFRAGVDAPWEIESEDQIFADGRGWPAQLADDVSAAIRSVVGKFRPAALLCPRTTGGHVDHRLVRHAVERALASVELRPELWYFDDLPYAMGPKRYHVDPFGDGAPPARRFVLATAEAWSAKLDAISAYASQMDIIWEVEGPWRVALTDHSRMFDGLAEVVFDASGVITGTIS